MESQGLREAAPVPKQNRKIERLAVSRALVIMAAIAVIALIAGFLAFGGGNMGH
jgi:hypothetical protein